MFKTIKEVYKYSEVVHFCNWSICTLNMSPINIEKLDRNYGIDKYKRNIMLHIN